MADLLIVDDEESYGDVLKVIFEAEGHRVTTADGGAAALSYLNENRVDVIISDVRMPDLNGIELLRESRKRWPDVGIVLMTAFGSIDVARNAFLLGADDFIQKPFSNEELKRIVERTLERQMVERENEAFRRSQSSKGSLDNLVGGSKVMSELFELIRAIAAEDSTVLISGESGTGKELVARAIHDLSDRSARPFVPVNCGGVAESLIDAELFGFEKGSFTGASAGRIGLFEAAAGGTIFLDEVGDMSPAMQVKVLRVLQERTVRPVGRQHEVEVDIRVIAATNRDLEVMVNEGEFREDLYYRLSVIPIKVPPLRDRREDISELAAHFVRKFTGRSGKTVTFSKEALETLSEREWNGNVRELENAVERAVALAANGSTIEASDVGKRAGIRNGAAPELPEDGIDFQDYMKELESAIVTEALKRHGGNQTKAAEWLRIPVHSLRHLMGKHSLGGEKAEEKAN